MLHILIAKNAFTAVFSRLLQIKSAFRRIYILQNPTVFLQWHEFSARQTNTCGNNFEDRITRIMRTSKRGFCLDSIKPTIVGPCKGKRDCK